MCLSQEVEVPNLPPQAVTITMHRLSELCHFNIVLYPYEHILAIGFVLIASELNSP